jgi:hypothetical protein
MRRRAGVMAGGNPDRPFDPHSDRGEGVARQLLRGDAAGEADEEVALLGQLGGGGGGAEGNAGKGGGWRRPPRKHEMALDP